MGIAYALQTLGFVTPETEPLATKIYTEAGTHTLNFSAAHIQALIVTHREGSKLDDFALKKLVTIAVLASNMVAMVSALAEVGIPADALDKVIADVIDHVRKLQEERKKNNPPNMN